jgi:hypothetical protein
MSRTILRLEPRHTNADLLADAQALGHVRGRVLDATYGLGIWWRKLDLEPGAIGMDKVPLKAAAAPLGVQGDFRRPPFQPETFDTIFEDADYKLNGTPTTPLSRWVKRASDGRVDERYGADERKQWEVRIGDMLDGIAWWPPCVRCAGSGEAPHASVTPALVAAGLPPDEVGAALARFNLRIVPAPCAHCAGSGRGPMQGLRPLLRPGGKLLVKCMDQVVSKKVRFQTRAVHDRATAAGLELVAQLDRPFKPRWQDPRRRQWNESANYSSLLVYRDTRPVRRQRKKAPRA